MQTPYIPSYLSAPRLGARCAVKMIPLPSIPAGSNPFHHDHFRMGTPITEDVMIMHSTPLKDNATTDIVFVDPTSGQRWQVVRYEVEYNYEPVVYISNKHVKREVDLVYLREDTVAGIGVTPVTNHENVDGLGRNTIPRPYPAGVFYVPRYVTVGNHAFLEKLVLTLTPNELQKLAEEKCMSDIDLNAVIELQAEYRRIVGLT